jgi:hypothetical protein
MAVRTSIVCILVLGVSGAGAEPLRSRLAPQVDTTRPAAGASETQPRVVRRPVAVIDLSNDQAVRDVANKLLDLLGLHAELAPPPISDGAALVDKLPPDDELRLTEARNKRLAAEQNLAQRNFREAAIDAVEGQELLLHVTPRAAISLYADLALALGLSRLGEKKDAEAREAFALTARLDPNRTLDDLHFLPEVIQTFEAARQVDPGTRTITVRGAGRVWIDGEEVGQAPGTFTVSFGRHVVWLTGMLRETGGKEILVTATRAGEATIMDGPLTRPQKVVRFRVALSQARDPAARANAMNALATFVKVHDAVLLSSVNGKITWQTWRDRAPGFSAPHELEHDSPLEILKQLAAPEPVVIAEPVAVVPLEPKRWYRQTRVELGLAATVVMAIVGGYLWTRYSQAPQAWGSDIKTVMGSDPNPARR